MQSYMGNLTRETERYWTESEVVCDDKRRDGVSVKTWDSFIHEKVDIKRAIPGRFFPHEFEEYFAGLWRNVERILIR